MRRSASHALHFEPQRGQLCGLHAVNALLQFEHGELFTKGDLDNICDQLDPPRCCHVNAHKDWAGRGDYDVNVILFALSTRGLDCAWHDARVPASRLDHARAVGLLLNGGGGRGMRTHSGRHWFAVRRVGDVWWDLNSMNRTPRRYADTGEMLHDVQSVLSAGGSAITVFPVGTPPGGRAAAGEADGDKAAARPASAASAGALASSSTKGFASSSTGAAKGPAAASTGAPKSPAAAGASDAAAAARRRSRSPAPASASAPAPAPAAPAPSPAAAPASAAARAATTGRRLTDPLPAVAVPPPRRRPSGASGGGGPAGAPAPAPAAPAPAPAPTPPPPTSLFAPAPAPKNRFGAPPAHVVAAARSAGGPTGGSRGAAR